MPLKPKPEADRRPITPLGRTNALKYGFYSRRFRSAPSPLPPSVSPASYAPSDSSLPLPPLGWFCRDRNCFELFFGTIQQITLHLITVIFKSQHFPVFAPLISSLSTLNSGISWWSCVVPTARWRDERYTEVFYGCGKYLWVYNH